MDILSNIKESSPCGENLGFSAYHKILNLKKKLLLGFIEDSGADWGDVIHLCEDLLKNKTKDLCIALWYWEALGRKKGLDGFLEGTIIVKKLVRKYEKKLFPAEKEALDNCINWANTKLIQSIMEVKISEKMTICDLLSQKKLLGETKEKDTILLKDILHEISALSRVLKEVDQLWHLNELEESFSEIINLLQIKKDI